MKVAISGTNLDRSTLITKGWFFVNQTKAYACLTKELEERVYIKSYSGPTVYKIESLNE